MNCNCVSTINNRIEELQADLNDTRARTRTFIVQPWECNAVYRRIDDLELQIETLENLRAVIERRPQ